MPDVPTPPTPKAAAKGLGARLKGHSPVVYGGVFAGAAAFAYYLHKQNQGAAMAADVYSQDGPSSTTPVTDPYSAAAYDPSGQYTYFPGPTTGAFLGGDSPSTSTGVDGTGSTLSDLLGAVGSLWDTTHPLADAPTGGGAPVTPSPSEVHLVVSGPAPPAAVPASPAPAPASNASPYGSKYPLHSARGWYREVHNFRKKGDYWHFYGPHDDPKIRIV